MAAKMSRGLGGSVRSTSTGSSTDGGSVSFRQILSQMAEALKPGGEIDKTMMADIDTQGKLLHSQLSASAIGRGMGNAQVGIPTQVFKNVSQAKGKARAGLLEQYMSVLTNLAQMALQQEQADASRAEQAAGRALSTSMPGYSQAGSKLTDFGLNTLNLGGGPQPSMQALPSLYAAGGMGQVPTAPASAPSLFGGNATMTSVSNTIPSPSDESMDELWALNPGLAKYRD